MSKSLVYVQILYALLIPFQIYSALLLEDGNYLLAIIIIICTMIMEIFGIQYWIKAQAEVL